jgi:hypothetical protein
MAGADMFTIFNFNEQKHLSWISPITVAARVYLHNIDSLKNQKTNSE